MSFVSKTLYLPRLNVVFRPFSTTKTLNAEHKCKLLVVGGGTGGCAVSSRFARLLKKDEVLIIDPSDTHYNQALFSLVGGGIKPLKDSHKSMKEVLPSNAKWLRDSVTQFHPESNYVQTNSGDTIKYEFMLIAMGFELEYDRIPGALEALEAPDSGVCSNYSPKYVNKTYKTLQAFREGNAVFTFPNSPVKCPGAPQKVCYISEEYIRKAGLRNKANITYNTSLAVIFGVKTYADALWKVVKQRNINVNLRTNLVEVKPKEKEAIFENLDNPSADKTRIKYSMLHISPPMRTPEPLRNCKELTDSCGFANVNKDTLQHNTFNNIFAIGDCGNTPNSKTAAAIASQSSVVYQHLRALMNNEPAPSASYDGYASCPLVTGYKTCIMAEFDYTLQPLETFPLLGQDRELYSMFLMKRDIIPPLYWQLLLKGYWNGPAFARKVMRLGLF